MTRWLEATTQAELAETKPTKPTEPEPPFNPLVLSEKSVLSEAGTTELATDPRALMKLLARKGPHTYGAAALALGIDTTRAWVAETELRRAGRIRHGLLARAIIPKEQERA